MGIRRETNNTGKVDVESIKHDTRKIFLLCALREKKNTIKRHKAVGKQIFLIKLPQKKKMRKEMTVKTYQCGECEMEKLIHETDSHKQMILNVELNK
jgi:ssDNA-binding Zn-finger/Zn-ribbon topoisomerase 1